MRLRPRLRPGPRWGSLQCSPDPLAGFKEPYFQGRQREGRGGKGSKDRGRGGEERGRKGRVLLLREGKEGEERGRGEWKGRGLAPPKKFLAPPLGIKLRDRQFNVNDLSLCNGDHIYMTFVHCVMSVFLLKKTRPTTPLESRCFSLLSDWRISQWTWSPLWNLLLMWLPIPVTYCANDTTQHQIMFTQKSHDF